MRLLITCLLAMSLCACQTSKVVVDYDTAADFSSIHHYQWLNATSGTEKGFDPLMAERVKQAVATQLHAVPLRQASNPEQVDVLVRYYVGSYTRSQESNSSGRVGIGSGGGHTAFGISLSFPLGADRIVKEAQITVDLVEPSDHKLKWRGTNRITISNESPAEITALINAAVAEIFSRYPPTSAAK